MTLQIAVSEPASERSVSEPASERSRQNCPTTIPCASDTNTYPATKSLLVLTNGALTQWYQTVFVLAASTPTSPSGPRQTCPAAISISVGAGSGKSKLSTTSAVATCGRPSRRYFTVSSAR